MKTDVEKTPQPETRDRILSTACRLFHRRGYTAVGVAEICREASVVKGSFYHFYSSKDDLLIEVLRRNWEVTGSVLGRLVESDDPGRDRIVRFLDMIADHGANMHGQFGLIFGCNIGVLASELGPAMPAIQGDIRKIFEAWRQYLLRLVEAGKQDGSISPALDTEAAAAALLASIQGMSTLGRTFNDPQMLKSIASNAMAQIPAP